MSQRPFQFRLWTLLLGIAVVAVVLGTVRFLRTSAHQAECQSNIRQLGVALHTYHDSWGAFPPAYTVDKNGRRMHSWRIAVLPFTESHGVWDRCNVDMPWDSPGHRAARELHAPRLLRCPNGKNLTEINYLLVVGPDTLFPGSESRSLSDVTDGQDETILIVEVANSGIHWMEPRDIEWSEVVSGTLITKLKGEAGHPHFGGNVAYVDLSTRRLAIEQLDNDQLQALLTINGGENVSAFLGE